MIPADILAVRLQSQDIDRKRPRVKIPDIGFCGHGVYSEDGQWVMIWRSFSTKGATAKGTPFDGSYSMLKRQGGECRLEGYDVCHWPHRALISNTGVAVIVFWEGKSATHPTVRVMNSRAERVLDDLTFSAPVDEIFLASDGCFLGVLLGINPGSPDNKKFMLWDLRTKQLVSRFHPFAAERHSIRVNGEKQEIAFHHYLSDRQHQAIIYSFDGALRRDSRFCRADPEFGWIMLTWESEAMSREECQYILNQIDNYKTGAAWHQNSEKAKQRLDRMIDELHGVLGLPRPVPVVSSLVYIDPKLGHHLDTLAAIGIHGDDRESVAVSLIRQGIERLAAAGFGSHAMTSRTRILARSRSKCRQFE